MRLRELLQSTPHELLRGSLETEVERVTADSRRIGPKSVFVAVRGHRVDGHDHIEDAIARGAVAIVAEDPPLGESGPTVLCVPSSRTALGAMVRAWHGRPDRDLTVMAITGTNGKTTVSHLLRDLWRARGKACGLLGTIEYDTLRSRRPAPLTTPGVEELMPLLRELVDHGGEAVAMEASSHALDQERLGGIEVDHAVFTNLTRDHLDYHETSEDYLAAKRRLLDHLAQPERVKPTGRAVVNVDDPVLRECAWPEGSIRVGHDADCDVQGIGATFGRDGTTMTVAYGGRRIEFRTRLLGLYNAVNTLLVAGVARAAGIEADEFAALASRLDPVPGRLEPVELQGGPLAIVDYAHTPDGLRSTLEAVRRVARGRIVLVFGCGGDRDRGKRPQMARVALDGADAVILTLDNPRTEDPARIFADTEAGFAADPDRATRIEDRADAIAAALTMATVDDVVLIAGKGHETYQILGETKHPWDDRAVVRAAFEARGGAR